MVEAFENDIVHPFQRSGPDSGVPNYLRDELRDGQHDVRVHRHVEQPGDAV